MKLIPLLSFVLLIACGQPQAEQTATEVPQSAPLAVLTEEVQTINTASPIVASGRLASQEEVRHSFKIGGIIKGIYADEGQQVRKGQLLARLDATEINAQVSQAEEALSKAERDLKRVDNLYADSVATLEQVQNLRTARAVAASNLEIARFNQQHAAIYATVSGKVLKRFAEGGELIGPGSPVLLIASTQGSQVVKVGLADRDIVRLQAADKAVITFDAWPGTDFPAKVSEIAAGADAMSGTFELELTLTETPKPLKNGFIAKVTIFPSQAEAMRQIPLGALVEAGPEYAAFYVPNADGKTARLHSVQHYTLNDSYLIVPAAEWGEPATVITRGAKYLRPNQAISIAAPQTVQPAESLSIHQQR